MYNQQPIQPQTQIPSCPLHGPMRWKSGISQKTGQPYGFFSCAHKDQGGNWCQYSPDRVKTPRTNYTQKPAYQSQPTYQPQQPVAQSQPSNSMNIVIQRFDAIEQMLAKLIEKVEKISIQPMKQSIAYPTKNGSEEIDVSEINL